MKTSHVIAVEKRLEWMRWLASPVGHRQARVPSMRSGYLSAETILHQATTFHMTSAFSQLVERARLTCPEHLAFEMRWLQASHGWCWLDTPFRVPFIMSAAKLLGDLPEEQRLKWTEINAVGWRVLPIGLRVPDNARTHGSEVMTTINEPSVQFLFYQADKADRAFIPWSYFVIKDGQCLGPRVEAYEAMNVAAGDGSDYVREPNEVVPYPLHEIRWAFAAFHLMAQRLATTVRHPVDRAIRRRAEHERQTAPPFLQVVTLRRTELPRERQVTAGEGDGVDWQWQWPVGLPNGFWRNHWYPSEGIHKPMFIEPFMKGPADKPVKPPSTRVFVARR